MKLGVMASGIAGLGWERALGFCRELGLDAIEIPCGAYPKHPLIQPEETLKSPALQQKIKDEVARHGLMISAPLGHPMGNCTSRCRCIRPGMGGRTSCARRTNGR